MEKLQHDELREHLKNFLPLININSETLNITENEDGSYTIKAGTEHQYTGFYPAKENNSFFTLSIINDQKKLKSGISVEYIEAFIFFTKDFRPYKFVIYQEPQTQTTYLVDDGCYHKGEIAYHNNCPCSTGGMQIKIDKPVLVSEQVDLAKLLA